MERILESLVYNKKKEKKIDFIIWQKKKKTFTFSL